MENQAQHESLISPGVFVFGAMVIAIAMILDAVGLFAAIVFYAFSLMFASSLAVRFILPDGSEI